MIDSTFDVELDGVRYRLERGPDSYVRERVPLRSNSQVVQGATRSQVNLRPDVLEWKMDDFCGGQGQLIWDPDQPNRYWRSHNLDVRHPHVLTPSRKPRTDDSWPQGCVQMVSGPRHTVYAVRFNDIYQWSIIERTWERTDYRRPPLQNEPPGLPNREPHRPPDGTTWISACSDEDAIFVLTDQGHVQSVNPYVDNQPVVGIAAKHPNFTAEFSLNGSIERVLNHLYVVTFGEFATGRNYSSVKVYEIPISEDSTDSNEWSNREVYTIDYAGIVVPVTPDLATTSSANRLYVMWQRIDRMSLLEIIPGDLNADGSQRTVTSGAPMIDINGFYGEAIMEHLGIVYILGKRYTIQAKVQRVLLAVPIAQAEGATYSVVGVFPEEEWQPYHMGGVMTSGQDGTYIWMGVPGKTGNNWRYSLWVYNIVTGGLSQYSEIPIDYEDDGSFDNDLFRSQLMNSVAADPNGGVYAGFKTLHRPMIVDRFSDPVDNGWMLSSYHDFGTAGPKQVTEMVFAGNNLDPDGILFQTTGYESVIRNYQTTSIENNQVVPVTRLVKTETNFLPKYTVGAYISLNRPRSGAEIDSIAMRATVVRGYLQWRLTLEISDESGQYSDRSLTGSQLLEHLYLLQRKNTPVIFLDGYRDRAAGSYNTHQVIVYDVSEVLSQPGQGYADVYLRSTLEVDEEPPPAQAP